MKRYTISLAAAMMIAGSAVFAQQAVTADQAVAKVKAAYVGTDFTRIEVRTGLTQIKVEAFSGNQKVEVILDKETGDFLKRETETAGIFENTKPGMFFSERNRDFLRNGSDDDSNDDDDDLDDSDDDSDDSDDDSSDDSSDDSDDDSNDDNDDDSNDDDSNDDDSNDDSSDD